MASRVRRVVIWPSGSPVSLPANRYGEHGMRFDIAKGEMMTLQGRLFRQP